jgi:hypothetical protein
LVDPRTTREVSSVPLSLTIIAGRPHRAIRASSSRTTRRPTIELSTTRASASRVSRRPSPDQEPPAPGQHVGDEVERPALVCCLREGDRRARAGGSLAATSAAKGQAFLAIQPVELLVV